MPGVSRRPRGQIPLPGDGGHGPSSLCRPGGASLVLLPVTKEERTLLRKAIIPRRPEPAATPCWGQVGHRGVPLPPPPPPPSPALGSRIRRYLFLDQPPAPTGSRLGFPASADSASPCPRPRCCCGGAAAPRLLSHGQRGDSRGTARSRSPEPCPAVPSQPRTAGRAAGSAAATAPRAGPSWLGTAGLAPARILPLPTAAPVPPPPRPSRDKAHGRVCCSPGRSPPLATFIPNHAPRAHAGSAGTAGTGCRAPRRAAVAAPG